MWQINEITVGNDCSALKAVLISVDKGVNIYIGGGEEPHIGTVVICEPRLSLKNDGTYSCTTSVHNFLGHKDDAIAIPIAETLCKQIQKPVVITAGVHLDNANKDEIAEFLSNIPQLTQKLLKLLTIKEPPTVN